MNLIYDRRFSEHPGKEPELPSRLEHFIDIPDTPNIPDGNDFLRYGHSTGHVERIRALCEAGSPIGHGSDVTQCIPKSIDIACLAVGASIMAADQASVDNPPFALVRPPGHHAAYEGTNRKDEDGETYTKQLSDYHAEDHGAAGTCLFNNVAIAAKYLAEQGERVFILDFDLHHGDGTEDIVKGDERIHYFSMHAYGRQILQNEFYPGTGSGSSDNCTNVPLVQGTAEEDYIAIVNSRLRQTIEEFNPDVIAVSAGFDLFRGDHFNQGTINLTERSLEAIHEVIKPYKRFFVLEGGYDAANIKKGVEIFGRE